MAQNNVYSFLSVVCGITGPGLIANLADGAAASEEGIEFAPTGDIATMTIGADGNGMHAVYGDKSGTVQVHLLKTSPMNKVLSAAYEFQTSNPASYGQNVITLVDKLRGDNVVAQGVGFKKAPDLSFAKEGKTVTWEFNAITIVRTLA